MQVRNNVTLIGNLGQAPQTIALTNGSTLTQFSLATNDTYRDKDGKRATRTEWHRVKAFGKLAEVFQQHLRRGSRIALSGHIRYRKWVDDHGQNRVSTDIIADSFTFLDAKTRSVETERAAA